MFKKSQLLQLENITSKVQVFEQIAKLLVANNDQVKYEEVVGKLLVRESQTSTGFEHGIAIPHAVVSGITEPLVIISRFNPIS